MARLSEPPKATRLERRAKQVQELEQQRRIVEAEIFYHQNETDQEIETQKFPAHSATRVAIALASKTGLAFRVAPRGPFLPKSVNGKSVNGFGEI